jgi:formylglycine-generating enzyme required for sulfatase activity
MLKLDARAWTTIGALALAGAAAIWWSDPPRTEIRPDPAPPERPVRPGQPACPPGATASGLGPDMVRLPEGFCIDTTEVTRGQYQAWLETSPATDGQPTSCEANTDYTPSCSFTAGADENLPVVCVDWCDARAFCSAAGKRLCGHIGSGDGYPFDSYDDPTISEWHAACTSGGSYEYTYGNDLDTTICRSADAEDYTTWGLGEAGSFTGCHSPEAAYAEVYDLSGNAAEWDNGCDGDAPEDPCRIRGGSYQHNEHGLRCAMARDLRWPRTRQVAAVGFRCCAD